MIAGSWKKKTAACVTLAGILITNAVVPQAEAGGDSRSVEVNVDWTDVRSETTELSYGLNGFKLFDPIMASNPKYNENMKYMNAGFIRYHAAESMKDSRDEDNRGWIDTANRTWDAEKVNQAISGYTGTNPVKLMNIMKWPSWMKTYDVYKDSTKVATLLDPSEYDNFAAFCAELVEIVNIRNDHDILLWEPTNEWDVDYYVNFVNAGMPDKLDELTTIYNKAALAMKEVDPRIQTGGLAFARGDLYPQVERFVEGTKDEGTLDFLSYHFYASGDLTESDTHIYDRVNLPSDPSIGTFAKHSRDIRDIVDEAVPDRHIPIFADEYNVSWTWTNNDPRMHNHKGAVYDALGMIYAHDNGIDGFTAWNEHDGVYGKMDNDSNLRTTAHLYQMLNNYMIGERVATDTSDESAVIPFAVTEEANAKGYMLVNRTNEVQTVRTSFEGGPGTGTIQQHQISENGYTITANSWERVTGSGITLPPNSVTLLTDSPVVPSQLPPPAASIEPNEPELPTGTLAAAIQNSASSVNLSSEGKQDWMYLGYAEDKLIERKSEAVESIGFELAGGITPSRLTADNMLSSTALTWGEGSSSIESKYLIANSVKDGAFEFTLPADATERQFKVYLGVLGAKARLTATLSDGSASPYEAELENSSWITDKTAVFNYKASSAGQSLKVRFELVYKHWDGGDTSIRLQGASLSKVSTEGAMLHAFVQNSAPVNLTEKGTVDWVQWGGDAMTRKADVEPLISHYSAVGDLPSFSLVSQPIGESMSWSDGTATPQQSNVKGIKVLTGKSTSNGKDQNDNRPIGFIFTVPADKTLRSLKIYAGAKGSRGELQVSLSDKSASDYTSGGDGAADAIESKSWITNKEITINYRAASDNQTLTVRYVLAWKHWGDESIWLQAAALSNPDADPPSIPSHLTIEHQSSTSASLSWNPSVDNDQVSGYRIYNGDQFIGTTAGASFFVNGLLPGREYQFAVEALDVTGNRSARSDWLVVETEADMQAPTAPGNVRAVESTESLVKLVWHPSFDNAAVTGYDVYRDGVLLGTVSSPAYEDKAVSAGRTYRYIVKAKDAAEQFSADSHPAVVTTANGGNGSSGSGANQGIDPDHADRQLITSVMIEQLGESDPVIELKAGATEIWLPAATADLMRADMLTIRTSGLDIRLPREWLRQLQAEAGDAESNISLRIQPQDSDEQLTFNRVKGAEIRSIGTVYDFTLTIIDGGGQATRITDFQTPLQLVFRVGAQNNQDLLGVYHISDSGELAYAGGTSENGQMTADVSHFSRYAVLEYDRSFADVPKSHWAYPAIRSLAAKHIVEGKSEDQFDPASRVTRAQFVTMLVKALKLEGEGSTVFPDVSEQDWYADAVRAAAAAGIVHGRSSGAFAPNEEITREEMAVMLVRALEASGNSLAPTQPAPAFIDHGIIQEWAAEHVNSAFRTGLLQGKDGNRFDPAGVTTRAESAQAILNLMKAQKRDAAE